MTQYILRLKLTVCLLVSSVCIHALPSIESLRDELRYKTTSSDSLELLFDIYDLTSYDKREPILEELFATATRANSEQACLDALSLMAGAYEDNDSLQAILLKRIASMPATDEQKSTMLYIKVRDASRKIRSMSEKERQEKMVNYMTQYSEIRNMDIYDRIEYLFYLCTYLRNAADGELLMNYMRELSHAIDLLPSRDMLIRALFYNQASMSFLNSKLYKEAAAVNKKMLDVQKELEKRHRASGRKYPYYSGATYLCYHQLLMCSEVLEPEEIDIYYNRALELIKTTKRLQESPDLRERTRIYYLMAKERYDEALPLIKSQLKKNTNPEEYNNLVEALIKAAKALNNKGDMLYALELYTDILEKRILAKSDASLREMEIIYEVNNLKAKNDSLMIANRERINEKHRTQMTLAVISLIVLVIMVIVLVVMFRRTKKLIRNVEQSNNLLMKERDSLRRTQKDLVKARDQSKKSESIKSDFVNNMSRELLTPLSAIVEYSNLIADCVDDERHSYVKRFADLVSLNSDLLLTLVNDVLELPSLESSKLSINLVPTSLKEICQVSLDATQKHINPGVSLVFANENDSDTTIRTDPHRVEQVLIHILNNAAKFTEKGSIIFEYRIAEDRKTMTFTVTDTGIGIPKGKEDVIFSRFEKVDSSTQGNGLGLYISRLLASLLKGELILDQSYRTGARFIFTIPIE